MGRIINFKAEIKMPSSLFVNELEYFCPMTNVCGSNLSLDKAGDETQCCTECSCQPECVDTQNCCFPKFDKFTQKDRSDQECFIPNKDNVFIPTMKQYFMTYKVTVNGSDTNISCLPADSVGNLTNKELLPVYSPKVKKIYVNQKCALLNGVEDGVLWDTYSICQSMTSLENSDRYLSKITAEKSESGNCELHFQPPAKYTEIDGEQCYVNIVSTCDADDFDIPAGSGMTKQEIRDLCQGGFFSPFVLRKNYASVFCFVCNGNYFATKSICAIRNTVADFRSATGFLTLLDNKILEEIKHHSEVVKEKCWGIMKETGSYCRKLYCPPGYVRDTDSECRSVIRTWIVPRLDINIKLLPHRSILVKDISSMEKFKINNPWPKSWEILELHYTKSDVREDEVEYFVVHLVSLKREIDFISLHSKLKKYLARNWSIDTRGTSFTLGQEIYEYKVIELSRDIPGVKIPFWANLGNLCVPTPILYPIYSFKESLLKPPFTYLIKTHFCELVELELSDYTLLIWDLVLYYHVNSRYFYDGEFTRYTDEQGIIHTRICVDELLNLNRNVGVQNAVYGFSLIAFPIFLLFI